MAIKPTKKPDWVSDDDPARIVEPLPSKKLAGWLEEEKPPFQFMNWLFNIMSHWINYFAGGSQYNVIIDSGSDEGDYTTFAAYIADSPQAGDRVLIKEDEVLTATLSIPSGIQLTQLKGKKFTIATTFSPVIQFGDDIKIIGDFRLETSNTSTVTKAFSVNGDNNHLDNLNLENKSTGTITDGIYVESGVEGNYARGRSINSGGGAITNDLNDNSGNDENHITVLGDSAISRSLGAKKFDQPDIDDFTYAQHGHKDASGGGGLSNWFVVTNPDYGASGSDQETTGSITTGTNTLTLAAAIDFEDGQGILIAGAGVASADLITQISSGGGTVNLVLVDNASTTVSGATVKHDDAAAIQAAIDAAGEKETIIYPEGIYNLDSPVTPKNHQTHKGVGGYNGSVIKTKSGTAGFTYATISFLVIDSLAFNGSGKAILQTDLTGYSNAIKIRNCHFWASLEECFYGNLILSNIEYNTFGYFGTPGANHRHIYSDGYSSGNTTNQNRITNNRFTRAVGGDEALYFHDGKQIVLSGNDFEANLVRPLTIKGLFGVYLYNNWFENNGGTAQVVLKDTDAALIGNQEVRVEGNWFDLGNAANTHIFSTSGAVRIDFINNTGANMSGKYISVYGGINELGLQKYENNYLIGYHPESREIASAAIITIPLDFNSYIITGNTNITAITALWSMSGREVTLIFNDILTLVSGSNIKLASSFRTSLNSAITLKLFFDGTNVNWYEVGRKDTETFQTIASTTELIIGGGTKFYITGTLTITSIAAADSLNGREITLKFGSTPTIFDGNNLKLKGDFVATADDMLSLVCDGTSWNEKGRSAN